MNYKDVDNEPIFNLLEEINNKYLNKIFIKKKIEIDIYNKLKKEKKEKVINIHENINNYIKYANQFFKNKIIHDHIYQDKLIQIKKFYEEASPNEKHGRDLGNENEHLSVLILIIYNFNLYDIDDTSDTPSHDIDSSNDENSYLFNLIISIYILCNSCKSKSLNYENELKELYDIDDFSCDEKSCNIQKKYLKYKHKYINYKKNKLLHNKKKINIVEK